MPWARGGDTSATYPPAMRVAGLPGADHRSVNEVFGFVFRLATQSAAHLTDYIVDAGTVAMIGGANTDQLLKLAIRVGLLARVRVDGATAFKLVDDPEFIHIRLKQEVVWERQQRADTSDPRLTVPVRARDGDRCRYCAVMVIWRGRGSTRKGTLDHTVPGEAATIDTLVVACKSCNSELRDQAGLERAPLRPAPTEPYYSEFTAAWLTKNGRPTAPTPQPIETLDERPGSQPENAEKIPADIPPARDFAASEKTPAPRNNDDPAGLHPRPNAPPPIPTTFQVTAGMRFAGSGRDGPGGSRSFPTTLPTADPTPRRRKRSRRGGAQQGGPS